MKLLLHQKTCSPRGRWHVYSSGDVCHRSTAWFELVFLSWGGCGSAILSVAAMPKGVKIYTPGIPLGSVYWLVHRGNRFLSESDKVTKNVAWEMSVCSSLCVLCSVGIWSLFRDGWESRFSLILQKTFSFSSLVKGGKNLVHLSVLI